MDQRFSFFEVFVIIGAVQGLVIAALTLTKPGRDLSKLLLSSILIAFSLLCVRVLFLTTGVWQTTWIKYFPLPLELAIPPLLWLYILSLVRPVFRLSRKHFYHLIPFGLSLVYSIILYLLVINRPLDDKDLIANNLHFNEVKKIEDYIMVASALVYWALGFRLVLQYRQWVNNNVSDTGYPTYAWLRNIALMIAILVGSLCIVTILEYVFNPGLRSFLHWEFFFGYLSILIYYLGLKGFQLPDKTDRPLRSDDSNLREGNSNVMEIDIEGRAMIERPVTAADEEVVDEISTNKNQLKLTEEKISEIETRLRIVFDDDELYLDPELSLNKLAKAIPCSAAQLSHVINSKLDKSFRNLVNEYRVKKVKERLADPSSGRYSILGIAYECGFNSEASFYRIFKSVEGVSPKEYHTRNAKSQD